MPRSLEKVGGIQANVETNTLNVTGRTSVQNMTERVVTYNTALGATAVDIDVTKGSIHYFTANASANFAFNFRFSGAAGGLSSVIGPGQALTVTVLVKTSDPSYYLTNATVDGLDLAAGTLIWNGAAGAPSSVHRSPTDGGRW